MFVVEPVSERALLQEARREGADELRDPPEIDVVEAHGVGFVQLEQGRASQVLEHLQRDV